LARPAVGLVDRDVLAGLLLPVPREDGVVLLVELARGVVGDVEQARLGARALDGEQQQRCEREQEADAVHGAGLHQNATWKRLKIADSVGRSPPSAPPPSKKVWSKLRLTLTNGFTYQLTPSVHARARSADCVRLAKPASKTSSSTRSSW